MALGDCHPHDSLLDSHLRQSFDQGLFPRAVLGLNSSFLPGQHPNTKTTPAALLSLQPYYPSSPACLVNYLFEVRGHSASLVQTSISFFFFFATKKRVIYQSVSQIRNPLFIIRTTSSSQLAIAITTTQDTIIISLSQFVSAVEAP